VRYKTDGQQLARLVEAYTFPQDNDGWKIVVLRSRSLYHSKVGSSIQYPNANISAFADNSADLSRHALLLKRK
jgi:hypothetical protein